MSFTVITFILFLGTVESLKCYFCDDSRDYGNCEAITWQTALDCPYSCVTWQGKIVPKLDYDVPMTVYTARYKRGCGAKNGCDEIQEKLKKENNLLTEFECKECSTDMCNDRANFPGHPFEKVNEWDET